MLFDLQGRRRRVVQVTYVGLAVLMGGGLVLSGIGSDAGGGILDALVGNNSDSSTEDARKPLENRVKSAETRLRANPKEQAALADLVRAHFALFGLEQEETDEGISVSDRGIQELRKAEQAWGRYIATDPKQIDSGLASTAIAIYDNGAPLPEDQKQKNARYVRPAADLAEQANTREAYIRLVAVATKAGDTRTAGLAERKARSCAATKDEEATIKEQIGQAKQQATPQTPQAGGNGAAPPPGGP